jgi:hypothetical protein
MTSFLVKEEATSDLVSTDNGFMDHFVESRVDVGGF